MAFQLALAGIVPGYMQEGLPVPSLGYKTLMYKCNAIGCIYITWITAAVLQYTGIIRLQSIIDNFGHLMTVAMIVGFSVSFGMYFLTVATGNQIRMSGNFIYAVFMGACLNPVSAPLTSRCGLRFAFPGSWCSSCLSLELASNTSSMAMLLP